MIANLGLLLGARPKMAGAPAIIMKPDADTPVALTYGALEARRESLAGWLAAAFAAGERVAILGHNSAEYLIALHAAMSAGLAVIPLGPRQGAATIAAIVEDARPAAIFVDPAAADVAPAGVRAISLADIDRLSGAPVAARGGGAEPAIQMYTSGSTGRPKGVLLSHDALLHTMRPMLAGAPARFRISIVGAPLFHMNGLLSCLYNFALGGRVGLLESFDAQRYLAAVVRRRANVLVGVPTMFALLLDALEATPGADVGSVRAIFPGSAPLSNELLRRIQAAFPNAVVQNTYGTTEAFGMFGADPAGRPIPPGSVGALQKGVEARLVDGPSADAGRLLVRTPASMSGYFNNTEATTQRLSDGWYDTGDLVRVEDGFFYIEGRADDMIICGGENIYPRQVEALLETHPKVSAAVIVAAPDQHKGQTPVAFVKPAAGAAIDPRR